MTGLLAIAALALGCLCLPGRAQADGDPASDFLLVRSVFLPYYAKIDSGAVQRLDDAVRSADQAGFRIRVALIAQPYDLGSVFQLYGQPHHYVTEDVEDYIKSVDILGRNSYHVVVGNPPYITVKDKAENHNYRDGYATCAGTYALSVPFWLVFELANFRLKDWAYEGLPSGGPLRWAGYVLAFGTVLPAAGRSFRSVSRQKASIGRCSRSWAACWAKAAE